MNDLNRIWECTPSMLKRRYEQLRPFVSPDVPAGRGLALPGSADGV